MCCGTGSADGLAGFEGELLDGASRTASRVAKLLDSSKGPNRVNRAHWPTKENRQKYVPIFSVHGTNCLGWPQMRPGGFFPTNPDLVEILGRMDLDFETFYFLGF